MSDAPSKIAPGAEPLDEIILGDDDGIGAARASASASRPPVATRSAAPPEGEERASGGGKDRKRAKMTLRIPDDEVSRPELPVTTPVQGVAAAAEIAPAPVSVDAAAGEELRPMRPQRIIAIGSADDTLEMPARPDPAPGIDAAHEPGWTPYQPPVADREAAPPPVSLVEAPPSARDSNRTLVDDGERFYTRAVDGEDPWRMRSDMPSEISASEEIPIDTDEPDAEDEAVTHPRLPVALDSEEVRVEDGERHTDPGEVPEVDVDDLVSVESIPSPQAAPPLLKHAKAGPTPPPPAVTASALMAGVTPQVPPVALPPLAAPPVLMEPASKPASVPPPSPGSPLVAAAAQPPPTTPAGGAPAVSAPAATGRGRVPSPSSSGGLAPPPMNEAAAARKKTRPWWEDLFNDDFIRTMAKISDADIVREANFIEESLGCEAGATILDLACGTGRHAVELASRGYQVVGFDLSLAMLARASDEAQERKQKINFVQGDMREMTFDETFDGIFSWNTSFGFFDEEKNAAVIAKVHRALKKGGQFLLDVVNRDYIIRQAPSLAWFEGDGCICMDEMQLDFITSRMKVKRTLMMDDGRTKEIEYSIRAYALHELGKLLHDNGFRVAEVSGRTGTPGVFFGCESPRTLILAEKR